jgi:DNA-binding transcriptional LysR family regulator
LIEIMRQKHGVRSGLAWVARAPFRRAEWTARRDRKLDRPGFAVNLFESFGFAPIEMIDPVNLDQLRVFLAVCETGSFSAAARRLRRAQSAVSRAIVALEAAINVTLFDRSGYVPTLTAAGKALRADAHDVLARVHDFKLRAVAVSSSLEPNLTLATHFSISTGFLVPILNDFNAKFPQTPVTLYTGGIGTVIDHVLEGTCAVGITLLPSVGIDIPAGIPRLERRHLADVCAAIVVAPSHPLALVRGPIALSELRRHAQLLICGSSSISRGWETGNILSDRLWLLTNLHEKRQFLLAGFGWGIMPMNIVAEDIAAGRLSRLEIAEPMDWQLPIPIYIITRSDRPLGPAGKWLVETTLSCGPAIEKASGIFRTGTSGPSPSP